jgi:histidinol-phosphatase
MAGSLPRVFTALVETDAIVLRALGRTRVSHKAGGSEVTAADRATARLLRKRLAAVWPRAATFSGDEYGGRISSCGWCWLVDPIDGTASFALGLPTFGTLIALINDHEPVFGCIHLPALGQTTWPVTNRGCWFRRGRSRPRRVRVRCCADLERATGSLTAVHATELAATGGRWRLNPLLQRAGRVRYVGECVPYALLCRGLIDCALNPAMKPWDVAALVPRVSEAGGVVEARGRPSGSARSWDTCLARTCQPEGGDGSKKRSNLSGMPRNCSASLGTAPLLVMLGHLAENSAFVGSQR